MVPEISIPQYQGVCLYRVVVRKALAQYVLFLWRVLAVVYRPARTHGGSLMAPVPAVALATIRNSVAPDLVVAFRSRA